ncbi:DNA-binding transcriptional LysR family regulator [Acinetobacter calcoaceticus]|uniref:DNA-binding transcriptional LysR family regulator n=1 Tax=Acinetobacter calcoaceticus TaxID=471 RepID=A0A4R1X8H6_ACICA|nr:DNA-binding transcriptional LysR family regulator [Acinetobacter calcoaceticus]
MQLKSLEIFVTVVNQGSFSNAAQVLHTVQSNITSHIKKLELELGCELLSRQSPIKVTSAGAQLLHYAEQILQLHQQAKAAFSNQQFCAQIPLSIGSMETTAAFRLPEIFHAVLQQIPDFKFNLHTQPTRYLIDAVQNHELDCAFVANSIAIPQLFNQLVWRETLVLVAAKHAQVRFDLDDLHQLRFIAFRQGCSYRRSIEVLLQRYNLPASLIVEMGSLDGIMGCVSLGMGVSILPEAYVRHTRYINDLQIIALDDEIAHSHTYLIAAQPETWNSNLKHFINFIQQRVSMTPYQPQPRLDVANS